MILKHHHRWHSAGTVTESGVVYLILYCRCGEVARRRP